MGCLRRNLHKTGIKKCWSTFFLSPLSTFEGHRNKKNKNKNNRNDDEGICCMTLSSNFYLSFHSLWCFLKEYPILFIHCIAMFIYCCLEDSFAFTRTITFLRQNGQCFCDIIIFFSLISLIMNIKFRCL